MAIAIQPYRPEHEPAVEDFNRRLHEGGAGENMVFYRWAEPRWLPKTATSRIFNEYFLAIDNGVVRGGYALKSQDFLFPSGDTRSIGYYHHPLSEGIVNKQHAIVGMLLLRDAIKRSPLLYCLGMGGYENPLPQMLIRLGWTHSLIPFYFRVVNPTRFLRNMQNLRSTAARKFLLDLASISGAGWLGSSLFQLYRTMRAPHSRLPESSAVPDFVDDATQLQAFWEHCNSTCSFTAVRNSNALQILYPATQSHLSRILLKRDGVIVGWAAVGERRKDAKYGNLRVGSIVDCFAAEAEMFAVIRAATQKLEEQGFDLILSNQSHSSWGNAFKMAGYLSGPSNFIFAASKELAQLLDPFEQVGPRMHFTRADGDGLPANF